MLQKKDGQPQEYLMTLTRDYSGRSSVQGRIYTAFSSAKEGQQTTELEDGRCKIKRKFLSKTKQCVQSF